MQKKKKSAHYFFPNGVSIKKNCRSQKCFQKYENEKYETLCCSKYVVGVVEENVAP